MKIFNLASAIALLGLAGSASAAMMYDCKRHAFEVAAVEQYVSQAFHSGVQYEEIKNFWGKTKYKLRLPLIYDVDDTSVAYAIVKPESLEITDVIVYIDGHTKDTCEKKYVREIDDDSVFAPSSGDPGCSCD